MSSSQKIIASRACPISGSNEAVVVSRKDRHGKALRNVISQHSGLIYVDPVPFKNTEEFYQTEYRKSYKGVHKPKPKHVYRAGKIAKQRYSMLSDLLQSKANCLDAGSSSGEFVYLLNSKGYNAQGVEASIPYAHYSESELGIPVEITPFSEFSTDQNFDLITMFHVLEHLEHPVRDLSHLGSLLKPNGYFVIEVPNILYPHMAFSNKWHPGHLFSFSAQTLCALMQIAGFRTISCEPVNNGGNLWGVFQYKQESELGTYPNSENSKSILNALKRGKLIYHLRFWNYLKFILKGLKQMEEKLFTNGKNGKEILDHLYH